MPLRDALQYAARGVACALLLLAPALARAEAPGVFRDNSFDTVVIDAGHGGDDHGGESPGGLREKDLVLDVAQRLARLLDAFGLRVVMTRDRDAFVALEERTEIANAAAGDLFLSIHANASRHRSARGVETFFASPDATDEAAREFAEAENRALGVAHTPVSADPLGAILGDLLATEHLEDSQAFAREVQRRVAHGARSRGVKQAPFVVLMGVRMPAVLVEVGFLSNAAEARALGGARGRARLAEQLKAAVIAFGERQNERRAASAGVRADARTR